jgi:hypothetical protein
MPESVVRPGAASLVIVGFRRRRQLRSAAAALAEAAGTSRVVLKSFAMVETNLLGRTRVRHGLPPDPEQLAEMRLQTIGPLVGVALDLPPRPPSTPLGRVSAEALAWTMAELSPGQHALVLTTPDGAGIGRVLRDSTLAFVRTDLPAPLERRLRRELVGPADRNLDPRP